MGTWWIYTPKHVQRGVNFKLNFDHTASGKEQWLTFALKVRNSDHKLAKRWFMVSYVINWVDKK